jgi:four helix bundle protein
MLMAQSYQDLMVWQEGIELSLLIYEASSKFPATEKYALCDQLQRASVSVPSNIAEGNQRSSTKQYLHFLSIARGSLAEVNTQIIIAYRLGYLSEDKYTQISKKISSEGALLNGLINALNKKIQSFRKLKPKQ